MLDDGLGLGSARRGWARCVYRQVRCLIRRCWSGCACRPRPCTRRPPGYSVLVGC